MNIVTLDPSLISTALVVSDGNDFKMFNYCRKDSVHGKKDMNKWFKLADEHINYKFIEYRTFEDYSEGEIIKLKDYDKITDDIISDILENINPNLETKIGIEGFSYSSSAGNIIDLVTFSTLLRKKLYDKVSNDILVLSPTSLKLEACKLTYPAINIGKKKEILEYRNNEGVAGGSFKKPHMHLSIIENNDFNDYWSNHCKLNSEELLKNKTYPKPHEDINDCFLLYKILKNQL